MTRVEPKTRSLEGKVAFITGAARGQGRSHAVGLAREGADIVAVDLCDQISTVKYQMATRGDLETTAEDVRETGRRCLARRADVRSLEQLRAVVADALSELGRIDIVVANAGIGSGRRSTLDLSEQEWEDVIAVNLSGVWRTVMAAVPAIQQGGVGGTVVIIGSTAGLRGMRGIGHYAASKHGLVGLAKTLAIELAAENIRVNCIHPTGVRTPLSSSDEIQKWAAKAPPTEFRNLMPVEMLEPEDVTDAVLWLSSSRARYITGVSLPVDAGFSLR